MLHYRRRLPHWIPNDTVVFVTWRLAGSAPPVNPETLTAENTGRTAFVHKDKALDTKRAGPFWLQDARVAQMVDNALRYGEIMPNHVHMICEPEAALPDVMCWLKGRTARSANRILRRTGTPFWQDESYDHWIRSSQELEETVAYVENNPVNAGLVEFADQWPWSSVRSKAGDIKRSPAPRG
jgi:putative transposase